MDARVDQIADMLGVVHPDRAETKDQRRSRALGLLADPEAVLALIKRYRALNAGATGADDAVNPDDRVHPAGTGTGVLPATTLYVHVYPNGVAELKTFGVLAMSSVRDLLAGTQVSIKPVIDLAHMAASTGYRPSDTLAEGVVLTNPRCVFPHCDRPARRCQNDHTVPYPLGQTEADNLGPLCDRHHDLKTHARGWRLKQPFNGIFVWRSPTGRIYVVDHNETLALTA